MQEPKPITDPSELLHRIRRLRCEADWDGDELDEALREGGVDPDHLVSRVMANIKDHLRDADSGTRASVSRDAPRPLLVALREATQLPSSAIAEALEVPVPFLSLVSRYPHAVPQTWRQELVRRAGQHLDVDQEAVLQSFASTFQFDRAARRDTPYTADTVQHYEDILERSGMAPDVRQFWQTLAVDV